MDPDTRLAKLGAIVLLPDSRTIGIDGGEQHAFRRIDIFLRLPQCGLRRFKIRIGLQRAIHQPVQGRRME